MIPFFSLEGIQSVVSSEMRESFEKVYQSKRYILGKAVEDFENAFADHNGVEHCVGVANGLDALRLSLQAAGVGPGDEVIVPAHTYIATWIAVSQVGATIVPVDADPETFLIDIKAIEEKISPRTKAILPVHLYGNPCDMESIRTIADRHHLLVIEDAAQSHGATWANLPTAKYCDLSATSFYPTKNLGALGDGGAVLTNNIEWSTRIRQLRNYGFASKDISAEQGVNSRLDELQAAFLSVKLRYLNQWNEEREGIAKRYRDDLANVGDLKMQTIQPKARSANHLFVIQTMHRDALRSFLKENGVETMIHYPIPPHLQKSYQSLRVLKGAFPVTENLANTLLSLPMYPGLARADQEKIIGCVRRFY